MTRGTDRADAHAATWQAWATALADTAIAPSATVTPDVLKRAATTAPGRPLASIEGARTQRLPAIDVHLAALDRGVAEETDADLVVRGVIAEGGMGKIYVAEQRSLAREVAIKTVRDRLDGAQIDALLREGAITGHLDHPGVTPVHLIGTSDGQPVLVMKRIAGLVWTELLQADEGTWSRFPALSKDRLRAHIGLLMEVARTIHFAHTRGVLHLDMKPDNVMIGELGEVYVVDWGVATTFEGTGARMGFVGTPAFVAPEMVHGEEIGPHTDVYLLGATLHLILTRAPRHVGASFLDVMRAAAESSAYAYDAAVPMELAELANACTARDPSARPRDALAVRMALSKHLEHATSLDLTKDGEAKLAELGALIDSGDLASPGAARLATETRYAFKTALDRWAENAQATSGLARALEIAARLEIARENAVGAREVIAEMEHVPPGIEDRLAELERALEARAKGARELAEIREDQDLGKGSRERRLLILSILVLGAIGFAASTLLMGDGMMAVIFPIVPILVALVVLGAVTLFLRRGLMANAASRRILATLYLVLVFLGIHRATTVWGRLDPIASEVRSELFVVSAICAVLGIFVSKGAWILAALPLVGAACVLAWPQRASEIYDVSAIVTLAAMLVVLGRSAKAPRPGA